MKNAFLFSCLVGLLSLAGAGFAAPSQEKAIRSPSGEKLGWLSVPGRLVRGRTNSGGGAPVSR